MSHYEIIRGRRGYNIVDCQGLWALEVSNKTFATKAEAQRVLDEHMQGIRKGHWQTIPGLLTDEGKVPL